ncbi:SDR family NAD(P)-dependent oxidoreductase [archaeon]|nr:MAG: SDR family NAD(P)-dependent oxidoreductase [archaeon]
MTGSTDGIGQAMAFEFAKKGLNLVLISRSQEKLETTAREISAKYPDVKVKVLAVDYSQFDAASRNAVADLIKDLDIGVLVNNVGISYQYTKFFHELDDERVTQLISLNVDSTTWMTRIVLPGMVKRKRGAIVNIGSGQCLSMRARLINIRYRLRSLAIYTNSNTPFSYLLIHILMFCSCSCRCLELPSAGAVRGSQELRRHVQ